MKVTIVGAGNAGLSHAAMIAKKGHRVTILKTTRLMHDDSFDQLSQNKQIEYVKGGDQGVVKIEKATRDIPDAISQADVIFVLTQSVAHKKISELISPHLRSGQILIVSPGYAGSFYFSTKCKAKDVVFVEGESLSFDARIIAPGKINICFENIRNPIGVFPSDKTSHTLKRLQELIPRFTARQNVLESAFHNPNLIVHTVGAIMSVARIEHSKGEFWMYRESFTPTIMKLVEDLDAEKKSILAYFGLPTQALPIHSNSEHTRISVKNQSKRFATTRNMAHPKALLTRKHVILLKMCLWVCVFLLQSVKKPISQHRYVMHLLRSHPRCIRKII